jgi:Lrp/AsnC family leucine-responsive transcriptional regulator
MDDVDWRLLDALRANGRASYAELGRLVGLSGPSVTERINRLEQNGTITGYTAMVPPAVLGLRVTALIGLLLTDSAELEDVGRRLGDVPEVEDCWFVAGEETYLLKVRVRDHGELERIIGRLNRIRGVARTRTTVALSTKWEGRLQRSIERPNVSNRGNGTSGTTSNGSSGGQGNGKKGEAHA